MGHGNPRSPSPVQPSALLRPGRQAGRHHEAWGLTAGPANKTQQAACLPTPREGRSHQSTPTFGKWPSLVTRASPGSMKEAPPGAATETPPMPTGLCGAASCGKEGKSVLLVLQKLLRRSVTASLGASARSPRTGTKLPRQLSKILFRILVCKNSPRTTCSGPQCLLGSAQLNLGCKKLWLPHSQSGHPDLTQRPGGEEIVLVSSDPGGDTYGERGDRESPPLPEGFRICAKRSPRHCSHFDSIGATSQPQMGGGWRGEEGRKRRVGRWALGPHPARPAAPRPPRRAEAQWVVSSVRSPHPEASGGTAAFLETGFKIY